MTLRNTVAIALSINMFLLGSEAFTEFYTDSAHGASRRTTCSWVCTDAALVPWIWSAIALNMSRWCCCTCPGADGAAGAAKRRRA
jgi:hypothetical protein